MRLYQIMLQKRLKPLVDNIGKHPSSPRVFFLVYGSCFSTENLIFFLREQHALEW